VLGIRVADPPGTCSPRAAARRRNLALTTSLGSRRAADNHLLLGAQAVGKEVSELSTAFGLALEMGARLEGIAGRFAPTRRSPRLFRKPSGAR
jgi:hypothetical protein